MKVKVGLQVNYHSKRGHAKETQLFNHLLEEGKEHYRTVEIVVANMLEDLTHQIT